MNKNLLKNTKFQAAVCGMLCIIFAVLSIAMADNLTMLAIWISLAISALVIGLWLLFGGIHEEAGYYNYFLLNRRTNKSVPAKHISFALVNENLSAYLSKYAANPIDLANPKSNQKSAGYTHQEREKFQNLLDAGFVDTFRMLHPDEVKYSWWSYMFNARAKNVGWRIDYFLASEDAKDKIVEADILTDVQGSDHCPVLLRLDV